jgi:hypothetical protein
MESLRPMRTIFKAITAATLVVGVLGSPAASANAEGSIRAVCAAPAPGHASCLGLRLVAPVSPANATPPKEGLSPAALHKAYVLPLESTEPSTIAIVDAFDDPNIAADLAVFEGQYGLLPCGGCFTKVNQHGQSSSLPESNGEWSMEIATDVEVARSVCQNCHILLVEANTASYADLEAAEETAAARIAEASKPGRLEGEISNSWGGPEASEPPFEGPSFTHPGIVITASAGDAGYRNWENSEKSAEEGYFPGPDYPASSPHVIAVGGTSLARNASGEWAGESVWNDGRGGGAGGGGCSEIFNAPSWQAQVSDWASVGCGPKRAVADVAADADPLTGVDVYDSTPEKPGGTVPKWFQIGGTSVAAPIVASIFALAGGAHGVAYPAATLYYHAASGEAPANGLHDVVVGGNGECNDIYSGGPEGCSGSLGSPLDCGALASICNAAPGYDGPTGVGSPNGLTAFQPPPVGNPGGSGEGSGSGGSGTGSGSSTGSGGSGSGSGGSGSSTGSSGGTGQSPPGSAQPGVASGAVRLTRLSLTLGAVIALNRGRSPLSRIAFTFVLSRAAAVRVTLARRVRVHGHWRWSALRGADTIGGRAGVNRAHLSGRGVLPTGFYRLTLTPAGGAARSLAISIG